MSAKPLRLEADDPEVLERTEHALTDTIAIPDPPLRLNCQRCGTLLARAGDTAHGPLFTSFWFHEPQLTQEVYVDGRKLNRRETLSWRQENEPLVYAKGAVINDPILHGVRALLTPGLNDYPDLLVRCGKHGDAELDRDEVLDWIRQAALKPFKRKIPVAKPFTEYRHPRVTPGPSESQHQQEIRRPNLETMTIAEYERLRDQNHGGVS